MLIHVYTVPSYLLLHTKCCFLSAQYDAILCTSAHHGSGWEPVLPGTVGCPWLRDCGHRDTEGERYFLAAVAVCLAHTRESSTRLCIAWNLQDPCPPVHVQTCRSTSVTLTVKISEMCAKCIIITDMLSASRGGDADDKPVIFCKVFGWLVSDTRGEREKESVEQDEWRSGSSIWCNQLPPLATRACQWKHHLPPSSRACQRFIFDATRKLLLAPVSLQDLQRAVPHHTEPVWQFCLTSLQAGYEEQQCSPYYVSIWVHHQFLAKSANFQDFPAHEIQSFGEILRFLVEEWPKMT